MTCLVCRATHPEPLLHIDGRDYWRRPRCAARFLDPRQQPSPEQELSQYRQHRNDPADAGYRRFLSRLAEPLLERLTPASQGLDYGCGPGPALAAMLHPGGWLALMTCFQTDDARFAGWHYRRDQTRVVFYREETLHYLAAERGFSCIIPTKDVALMRRPR